MHSPAAVGAVVSWDVAAGIMKILTRRIMIVKKTRLIEMRKGRVWNMVRCVLGKLKSRRHQMGHK